LQPGDRFVSIDGHPIEDQYDYIYLVNQSQGRTVPIVVERDGAELALTMSVPVGGLSVTEVEFGSPAGEAGWLPGDRVVAISGETVSDGGAKLIDTIRAAGGQPFTVTVERDGQTIESTLVMPDVTAATPFDDVLADLGVNLDAATTTELTGVNADVSPEFESVPFAQIIPRGFSEAYTTTVTMIDGIRELVTSTDQWDQIAGPIGMGQITNEALEASPLPTWVTLTRIAIVLSLNLALLNLFPLPALDGGRLLFVAIEILRGGRRIAPEKEGLVHLVGFLVLIGFMFVVAFYDVDRILDGRSFIP
jgi:regulator of sigma E protease